MDIQILVDELTIDPLTRGYSGMSDEEVVADMNDLYCTRQRTNVAGYEILAVTDDDEWDLLTEAEKTQWLSLCAIAVVDIGSGAAMAMEAALFGPGTVTRTSLVALKTEDISRGTEIGWGLVKVGHIEMARSVM